MRRLGALSPIGNIATKSGGEAVEADYQFQPATSRATANGYFASFITFLGSRIMPRRSVLITRQDEAGQRA